MVRRLFGIKMEFLKAHDFDFLFKYYTTLYDRLFFCNGRVVKKIMYLIIQLFERHFVINRELKPTQVIPTYPGYSLYMRFILLLFSLTKI